MRAINSPENLKAAFIFRCLGLLSGISGIIVHSFSNNFFSSGFMVRHNLAYFTLQTNIFSTLIFGILVLKSLLFLKQGRGFRPVRINRSLHLACTLYITVTMLGFWLVLAPTTGINMKPFLFIDTMLLHTLTPLMAILDYFLFAPHGGFKKKEIFKWLIYPVFYLISVVIVSALIKEPYYSFTLNGQLIELMYPYPFLDPQVMGTGGVICAIAAMTAVFLALGLLFIHTDSRLSRSKK